MNIQIRCEATISKKLEKICEFGESIDIRFGAVKGNKAEAVIRLVGKNGVTLEDVMKMGITSIEFRAVNAGEEAPTLTGEDKPMNTLFARNAQITPENHSPIVVPPPGKRAEVVAQPTNAPIPKNAIDSPVFATPPATTTVSIMQPIMSYAELMENLMAMKGLDAPLPEMKSKTGSKTLKREEALEYEKKIEGLPRLLRPMYVGNVASGSIVVNDLNQAIKLGEVVDFSKVPAKKLMESRDLRGLLLQKMLKFCTEAEYMVFLNTMGSFGGEAHEGLATGSQEEMRAMMELGYVPQELANKKSAKAIGITHETRDAVEIDLEDEALDAEMDDEMEIFQQITDPSSSQQSVSAAPRPKPKPSGTVKSINRVKN